MSRLQTMSNTIDHSGVIERIEGSQLFIQIVQQSACADCHAKGMCSASDSKTKIIEVTDFSGKYKAGDTVTVCGKISTGLFAVLLAFVLPICAIVGVIILGNTLQWNEGISALIGLLALIPYYLALYLFRDQMKKKFVFSIRK